MSALVAAFDQQIGTLVGEADNEYAEGASDMLELLLPLLLRTPAERGDPAIEAAWSAEEAALVAEVDRRPPEYNEGSIAACEAFLGLIDAIRAAQSGAS